MTTRNTAATSVFDKIFRSITPQVISWKVTYFGEEDIIIVVNLSPAIVQNIKGTNFSTNFLALTPAT